MCRDQRSVTFLCGRPDQCGDKRADPGASCGVCGLPGNASGHAGADICRAGGSERDRFPEKESEAESQDHHRQPAGMRTFGRRDPRPEDFCHWITLDQRAGGMRCQSQKSGDQDADS